MGKERIDIIREVIDQLSFVHLVGEIQQGAGYIVSCEIDVDTTGGVEPLRWAVEIFPLYPMMAQGHDSIRFTNKGLMEYPHIMEESNLCLHTNHAYDLHSKLRGDLTMLKQWVDKYYVNGEKDDHYEHLVVNTLPINGKYYTFLFAEAERPFKDGDYGWFDFGSQMKGLKNEKTVDCFSVIGYLSNYYPKSETNNCKWRAATRTLKGYVGIYCFLSKTPDVYGKFIIKDYKELNKLMSHNQVKFVNDEMRKIEDKHIIDGHVVFMVGYSIPSGEVQWQTMLIPVNDLPFEVEKVRMPGTSQNQWLAHFTSGNIQWAQTINSSYEHFFGRGAYPKRVTDSKILIIGVGAIGSMVAVALTRCGARDLSIYDFDDKKPGNICRSEYEFLHGCGGKVFELSRILYAISPFVECKAWDTDFDMLVKGSIGNEDGMAKAREFLNEFDIVFDCSTDNDMMKCLDQLELRSQIVNMSISNHAQELVCAFSPEMSGFVEEVYTKLLKNDLEDVYNPTGCWNPTFKASYTDIACMVQLAMKHIVKMISGEEEKKNFVIVDDREGLKIQRL
jgi:hypothetical protein